MLTGNGEGGFGALLGKAGFPAELMKGSRKEQGVREAVWLGQLSRQGQSLLDPIQGLIGFSDEPKRPGGKAPHCNSGILSVAEGIIAMPGGVVTQERLLKMLQGKIELTQVHEGDLQCPMTEHREPGVGQALGESQKFFSDLAGRSELGPHHIECPQAPEYLRDFRRLAQLPTKLSGTFVGAANISSRITLGRNHWNPESELKAEFLPGALGSVGQRSE